MKNAISPIGLKDVARDLNIAVSTVSRALYRPQMVHPDTVARVRETVERLGYRPNRIAQNLKLGTTGIVYVVVPSLSPFFLEIFRGIERAARELGYSAVMGYTDRDPVREGEFFDQVACGVADGVLLVSTARIKATPQQKYRLPPTVVILDAVENQNFPTVRVDHVKGAVQATDHLIALGHTRIAHIMGNPQTPMAAHRREGYFAALAAAGLKPNKKLCVPGEFTVEAGEAAMKTLLAQPKPPTAIFAASDEIAVGAIRAILAAGFRVPQDISVIGFDDQRISRLYNPPLSTIHLPTFDMGYQAMVKLRCILAHQDYEHDAVLPTRLIKRGTTAPPPKTR